MNNSVSADRLKILKKILFEEAKKNNIYDPVNCLPKTSYNEVFPNCFLGDMYLLRKIATDKDLLKRLGITHVLNAAKGEKFSQINTNQGYYNDLGIKFHGCSLMDVYNSKIEDHFDKATDFIHEALSNPNGKILVHCFQGISRSASFILAYLISFKGLTLEDSIRMVFKQRLIWPNEGFLAKLVLYEEKFRK